MTIIPQRLSILIFHRVLPSYDPLRRGEPDPATFKWKMKVLKRLFSVISLEEGVQRLQDQSLPMNAACVTFDDGYADNYTYAAPILSGLGIPATFFISTGFLDGGVMWNDKVIESWRQTSGNLDLTRHVDVPATTSISELGHVLEFLKYLPLEQREAVATALVEEYCVQLPIDLMLTTPQVRRLVEMGHTVGAHTHSHPILKLLGDDHARVEIQRSKQLLTEIVDRNVDYFAYPNGRPDLDYSLRDVHLVKQLGFKGCVSTSTAAASPANDIYQLPRVTPWNNTPLKFGVRLILNHTTSSAISSRS